MRPLPLLLLALLAALGCGPREDRSDLARRPIPPPASSGWARLALDSAAERALENLWLGDAAGASIPFEREREDLWQPLPLRPRQLLLGHDGQGRPSAEFSLDLPAGHQLGEHEHLKLTFELEGQAPWSCRLQVDRRLANGDYLTLVAPLHLYDLGESGKRTFCYVPWDAADYRLSLEPTQGQAPRLTGLTVTANTVPAEQDPDAILVPAITPIRARDEGRSVWNLRLPTAERVVGADLQLQAPVAPVRPVFRIPAQDRWPASQLYSQGALWNLPALGDSATRVELHPVLTDQLELELPAGVTLASVKLLVRHEVLLFPASAGQPLYLHSGGRRKAAAGSLGALPAASRGLYAQTPLRLGPPEPDPQGLPRLIEARERTRPWLPWATGAVVALLGFAAFRLLRQD